MSDSTVALSFGDAISTAATPRRVLMGNGFSIACRPDVFSYDALFTNADFSRLSVDRDLLFGAVGSTDFEAAIAKLRSAASMVRTYAPGQVAVASSMETDAELIKEALAQVLASRHPERPDEVTDPEYEHAIEFLSNFDRYYTLNYDLLLYWILMHDDQGRLVRNDGFAADADDELVTWDPTAVYTEQRAFYMHGALHLRDTGASLQKYTWIRTGIKLIDQIRDALASNAFPLVVTEGTSVEKLERILHSAYLNHAMRSLRALPNGSLFLFGHSLSENDDHILSLIPRSRVRELWVSLRGDPNSTSNQELVSRSRALAARRSGATPLAVRYYDANSAHVWR